MTQNKMDLGAFSISLAVKDLAKSKAFYAKLGFTDICGDANQGWLILRNGTTTIGLFQGMFDKNILTFNPGFDWDNRELANFTDIRDLQKHLEADGVTLDTRADKNTTGPASFTITDPDGNPILVDQHVASPQQ